MVVFGLRATSGGGGLLPLLEKYRRGRASRYPFPTSRVETFSIVLHQLGNLRYGIINVGFPRTQMSSHCCDVECYDARVVFTETLRKYPVFGVLSRSCTQTCVLSTGLKVEEGTLLLVPVFCLQRDPLFFPRPDSFQPSREFVKGAYLPFGAGPRTCLGKN